MMVVIWAILTAVILVSMCCCIIILIQLYESYKYRRADAAYSKDGNLDERN